MTFLLAVATPTLALVASDTRWARRVHHGADDDVAHAPITAWGTGGRKFFPLADGWVTGDMVFSDAGYRTPLGLLRGEPADFFRLVQGQPFRTFTETGLARYRTVATAELA